MVKNIEKWPIFGQKRQSPTVPILPATTPRRTCTLAGKIACLTYCSRDGKIEDEDDYFVLDTAIRVGRIELKSF